MIEDETVDLVVISTKGDRGQFQFGSVADKAVNIREGLGHAIEDADFSKPTSFDRTPFVKLTL